MLKKKTALIKLITFLCLFSCHTLLAEEKLSKHSSAANIRLSVTILPRNHLISPEESTAIVSECKELQSYQLKSTVNPVQCRYADQDYAVSKSEGVYKITYVPI